MSNEIKDLAAEKNVQQSAESTVNVGNLATKAERRAENKKQFLQQIEPAAAIDIAMATAHRKELELQSGCKLTRKQRADILKGMAASIQACAGIGYRIKQSMRPDDDMLKVAMEQPQTLEQEIRDAAEHAPAMAAETAQRAGMENLAAELAAVATAETSAHREQTEQQVAGMENQPAASATVATAEHSLPSQQREQSRALGRPSTFTADEADNICAWIQSGKSLNSYCKQHGRQAATIYAWMREESELGRSFARNYARAHEDRADTLVEDMLDIADSMEKAADMTQVMAGKLRIETRKWIAERMRPTKYGAKIEVQQKGHVTFNLGVQRGQPQQQIIDVNPVQIDLDKA